VKHIFLVAVIVMASNLLDSYSRAAYGTGASVMNKWMGTELPVDSPLGMKPPNPETPEDIGSDIIRMMQEKHPEIIQNMDRYYNEHPEELIDILRSME
jgi:hypothetical protein